MANRHPIQISETLWERLNRAALKEGIKQGKVITPAEFVRQTLEKHLAKEKVQK